MLLSSTQYRNIYITLAQSSGPITCLYHVDVLQVLALIKSYYIDISLVG